MRTRSAFCDLHKGRVHGVVSALVDEPVTVTKSLIRNPETSAVLGAAETIPDSKTRPRGNIEAGLIKSIIDSCLADHGWHEALRFVDALKRAQ